MATGSTTKTGLTTPAPAGVSFESANPVFPQITDLETLLSAEIPKDFYGWTEFFWETHRDLAEGKAYNILLFGLAADGRIVDLVNSDEETSKVTILFDATERASNIYGWRFIFAPQTDHHVRRRLREDDVWHFETDYSQFIETVDVKVEPDGASATWRQRRRESGTETKPVDCSDLIPELRKILEDPLVEEQAGRIRKHRVTAEQELQALDRKYEGVKHRSFRYEKERSELVKKIRGIGYIGVDSHLSPRPRYNQLSLFYHPRQITPPTNNH